MRHVARLVMILLLVLAVPGKGALAAGMTIVFRVKDPAMLERVQAGDKVRFAAGKVSGQITVSSIEVTK
ncbi:MAG: copper-binding protein [Betaproteobacteria bacterium]